MARRPVDQSIPREPDSIEAMPLPCEQTALVGQPAAERALLDAFRSGRPPHALLLSGPRGIGKATLAYRFARFVLHHRDPDAPAVQAAEDLSIPADAVSFRKVATGSHPGLLELRRPYDDKAKRFKTELTVDEVRRIIPFIGATAADEGWRLVLVDAADDMNASAANALLKGLEEPPKRTIFLVIGHSLGALLPTLRSRCRLLPLRPLSQTDLAAALAPAIAHVNQPESDLAEAARLSEGSVRQAAQLITGEGVATARALFAVLGSGPGGDRRARFALAETIAGGRDAEQVATAVALSQRWLSLRMAAEAAAGAPAERLVKWADLFEWARERQRRVEIYNLDQRQFLLDLLDAITAIPPLDAGKP